MKTDKLLHFYYATIISFLAINTFANISSYSVYITYGVLLLGFAAKEIVYDKLMKKGTPEFWDWFVGAMGATIILLTKII